MEIWKFKLEIKQEQFFKLPKSTEILDIQMQHEAPAMWAIVNPDEENVEIKISMFGTGQEFNQNEDHTYLATVQDANGLVWHYFMSTEK